MPPGENNPLLLDSRTGISFPIDDKRSGSGQGVCEGHNFSHRTNSMPGTSGNYWEGWAAGVCVLMSQGAGSTNRRNKGRRN